MKNIILTFTVIFFVFINQLKAQEKELKYANYDWESSPKLANIKYDTSNHSVVIFDKVINEYAYDKEALALFKIVHKRIKLITNIGIERNNKIYIPVNEEDKVIREKARVIKKDGQIRELNKSEIKEGVDDDSKQKYQYFAFEGVEAGCEIEFYYYIKKAPVLNGALFTLQFDYPTLHEEFKFITPKNLFLKFKNFNGCNEITRDTAEKEVNVWNLKNDSIPKLKEEEASAYKADKMMFAMKLDRNSYTGKKDLFSYGEISSSFYDRVYNNIESKDQKAIKSLCKEIKLDEANEESKIRSIENYLKTNFIYSKTEDAEKSNISKIISNKSYNDLGAIRIMANVFKNFEIEHELVITSNRYELKFDKEYESYIFLDEYLFYFPKIKKFLMPNDNFTRLGFPESSLINNYGLFIKGISMGDFNTGIGKIKFIDGAKCNESHDKLILDAIITSDFQDTKFDVTREMTGYLAASYQPYFNFIKEEDKLKEFSESIIKYIDKEGKIENLVIENKGANFLAQKPFIAKAKLTSNYFFEKAGPKYLFKVGMLIGPQMEMYKKEERKLPVEFPFPHNYIRTISFNIPDGYKVSNLDLININEVYVRNGDTTMAFTSKYKIENNKVIIDVVEFYKEYQYTSKEFEEYRRVGNASANFNKVVFVFEKQ